MNSPERCCARRGMYH